MEQKALIEEITSTESLDALFELLEEMPPLTLGRNDPCTCGSGLKYKKCCLTKKQAFDPSTIYLKSFAIKTDALTHEEAQDDFEDVLAEDEEELEMLARDLMERPETINSEDCQFFQKLNAFRDKYPNNPKILNYLTNGYDLLEQKDRVDELIALSYEKFPTYLFAKTAKAGVYLSDGFPDEALDIFKGASTIKELYPNRTVFHISEVKAFEHFMVRYFCHIQNFEQAGRHLQFMESFLEDNDSILQNARKIYKKLKAIHNFKTSLSRMVGLKKKEA